MHFCKLKVEIIIKEFIVKQQKNLTSNLNLLLTQTKIVLKQIISVISKLVYNNIEIRIIDSNQIVSGKAKISMSFLVYTDLQMII